MNKLFLVALLGANSSMPVLRRDCTADDRCGFLTCHECCSILMERMAQRINRMNTWTCERKAAGECTICDHLAELCCDHAKICQELECSVPLCSSTKQKLRDAGTTSVQAPVSQNQPLTADAGRSDTREWTRAISGNHRNHLIHEFVKAIFPTPTPDAAMQDQRMKSLVEQARIIESNIMQTAVTRPEYYHMLLDKIIEVRKEIEERRYQQHVEQARNQERN